MRCFRGCVGYCVLILASPVCLAVELTKEAVDGWDRYILTTEAKLESRFRGEGMFLGPQDSPAWRQQLRNHTTLVYPSVPKGVVSIKGGLIQDWSGAVFVPNSSLKQVLSIVQDYDHHKAIYKPDIAEAKLRSRSGDNFNVFMRIVKSKLMLSAVLNTDHDIRFTTLDSHRVFSRAYCRRIAEVSGAGKQGEHELPVGQDHGYIWRITGYWFFEERDSGVYISCQSITLTRDIPFLLEKVLGPVLRELPGESLRLSLEQTRNAITALAAPPPVSPLPKE